MAATFALIFLALPDRYGPIIALGILFGFVGVLIILVSFGILLGISQNYVFHRFDIEMRNWTRATRMAGWVGLPISIFIAFIGLAAFSVLDAPLDLQLLLNSGAAGGFAFGTIIGLFQRKKVSPQSSWGWIWVLTSAIAMGIALAISLSGLIVAEALIEDGNSVQPILTYGILLLGLLIGGGSYGLITAQLLVRMPISAAVPDPI